MAPITKKNTGPTLKVGAGLKSSSIGKSSGFGSGKASGAMGSSGKSGKSFAYSEKTASFFGASSKSSSEKHSSFLEPKSHMSSTPKSSGKETSALLGTSAKNNIIGSYSKSPNILGSSDKSSKLPTTNEKSSNLFNSKSTGYDVGHNYPTYINAKSNKPSASFGIIWLPTRKHKKKDTVYSSHNYDNYKNRSPSMHPFMSGDSPDYQPHKKKEEELLLVKDPPKVASVAVNTGITAANIDVLPDNIDKTNPEEKQEFIRRDPEDNKDGAGDTNDVDSKSSKDYLENKDNLPSKQENKWDSEKPNDKVDSVYLRPPPPHKARSTPTANEEEDCGIKCLYYTLQCCDCVLQ